MRWHDIVNDVMPNGRKVTVTYDPRTWTPLVLDSGLINVLFGSSGKVYENNIVLYDSTTQSRWVQQHVCAPPRATFTMYYYYLLCIVIY